MKPLLLCVVLVSLVSGCSAPATRPIVSGDLQSLRDELNYLKEQIRRSVAYPSCDNISDCDAVATGYAPCGGEREYVIYSKRSSNATRLLSLASQRVRLNQRYNDIAQLSGTCEIVRKPWISCRASRCVAR